MKLRTRIVLYVIMIMFFSVGSITLLSYYQMKSIFNDQLEEKLMNIASYISEDYLVKNALLENIKTTDLNNHIEKIRIETEVDFIVIFNMNGIRLTHPNKDNIGKAFAGGDETRVLVKGEEYISLAEGTLGTSIRSFYPIFHNRNQLGAVCVGTTLLEINNDLYKKTQQFLPFILVGFSLGICCAFILASNIKDEMMGLEPKEIKLLLKEKEAILENVKEGIITLNENGKLIQYNKEASKILGLSNADNYMQEYITEYIIRSKIYNILNDVESDEVFEVKIKPGITILCKSKIMRNDKNKVIGQVINFRDLTEMKKLADELTGIKKMAWSLRAQNHEFLNKLHTISGLIQLEEYDEAIKYITNTAKTSNDIATIITKNIKNMSIAALLLTKYYKAEELRIKLEIDKNSNFDKCPDLLSEDDVGSIIGNLIENSLDAVSIDGTGKVFVKISVNHDNLLIIEIKDNGPGIPEEIRNRIYERNFSTKADFRGYGMYIVKSVVESANGKIILTVNNGTSWRVEIPMKGDIYD